MNLEENIFSATTKARAIQIFNTVSTRGERQGDGSFDVSDLT
jgi:hypothetical protein